MEKINLIPVNQANDILIVNRQDKAIFIDIGTINRIEATGAYTHIFYEGNKISSTKSLTYYENLLLDKFFVKIHRSCLINIKHIKEVIKNEGEGIVLLKEGTRLMLSKNQKDNFLRAFMALNSRN